MIKFLLNKSRGPVQYFAVSPDAMSRFETEQQRVHPSIKIIHFAPHTDDRRLHEIRSYGIFIAN